MDYSGTKQYTVCNKQGETLGSIAFNPLDASIIIRYKEAFNDIGKMIEPLQKISLTAEGTAESIADTAVLQMVERNFREAFDSVFGAGSYNSFFCKIRPFAAQGHTYYSVNVMRTLSEFIANEVDKAVEELKRMGYTAQKEKRKFGFFRKK
jgi:hypothetical protein